MYTRDELAAALSSSGLLASADARAVLDLEWSITEGDVFVLREPLASSFSRRAAGPASLTGNNPTRRAQLAELGANLEGMLGRQIEWLSISYHRYAGSFEILRVPNGRLLGCFWVEPRPLQIGLDPPDPERNNRPELTIVADESVPSGLLHCRLYVDGNHPGKWGSELYSKRASHRCSFYVSSGEHRLQVRATFPGTPPVEVESNAVYFYGPHNVHVTFRFLLSHERLLLRAEAEPFAAPEGDSWRS